MIVIKELYCFKCDLLYVNLYERYKFHIKKNHGSIVSCREMIKTCSSN